MPSTIDDKKLRDFGAFLKNRRVSLGYSVRKAARLIDVPFGVLASIERGERAKIRMEMLEKIASLYDVDMDGLCIMCERIPRQVFYKIIRNPELLSVIREYRE